MADNQFLVLIGSRARGDANSQSDTDLLNVAACAEKLPRNEVTNVVQVPWVAFDAWYRAGSLFLYHAFVEGKVLRGSHATWSQLASDFRVQECFAREVSGIAKVTDHLRETEKFGGKHLWPLVNAFTLVKNASIFYLAHHKTYIFNKDLCIEAAVADPGTKARLLLLKHFYNYSIRNLEVPLPFDPNDSCEARLTLRVAADAVRGMADAIA